IDRSNAIARRQHAIKSRWRPTALDMTKHYGARLKAGAGLKFRSQRVSDAAKPHVPELVCLPALGIGSAVGKLGAFRHHNDAEIASTIVASFNGVGNFLDIKRLLGNQDYV